MHFFFILFLLALFTLIFTAPIAANMIRRHHDHLLPGTPRTFARHRR